MVTEDRQTRQNEVDGANLECHASQQDTVVCRQWRRVKQCLQYGERQRGESASHRRRQDVT